MKEKHYKKQLSAYLNHELSQDERQIIAEHLLQCADCRKEHDEIKFGVALAGRLPRADAPENVWNEIENTLNSKKPAKVSPSPIFAFFTSYPLAVTLIPLFILISLISVFIYYNFYGGNLDNLAKTEGPKNQQPSNTAIYKTASSPGKSVSNQNVSDQSSSSNVNLNANSTTQAPATNTIPKSQTTTKDTPPASPPKNNSNEAAAANPPAWNVETLAGMPKIDNSSVTGKLAVGEVLETDADSRAKIQVANIGDVEIAPNSRVKLVKTQSTEHRLSLERGALQAKILAPPRLFIVDTPSAVAVDLGCAYKLEVDKDGNSKLHVTSGYVALESGGREAIIPAAGICLTKRGKGIGTPFFETVSPAYQKALWQIDFENGGSAPLQTIINESRSYDSLTLWHLLSRVRKNERERVFDKLVSFVRLPDGVTKDGVLKLDKKMLESWRTEMANLWFEDLSQ